MSSTVPPVRITGHPRPQGRLLRGYVLTAVVLGLSARRELLAPGSWAYEALLATRPQARAWAPRVQAGLFYFLVGAHALEALFVAVPRLRKHRVPAFGAPWCKWMLAWLVAGVYAMQHFDAVVEAETARAKEQ